MRRVESGQTGKDLGLVLRWLRWCDGWTQSELAQRTGISLVQIAKLETAMIIRPQAKTWKRVEEGAGLRRQAVPIAASRLRRLQEEIRCVVAWAKVQKPHQPPDADLDTDRIFGATF